MWEYQSNVGVSNHYNISSIECGSIVALYPQFATKLSKLRRSISWKRLNEFFCHLANRCAWWRIMYAEKWSKTSRYSLHNAPQNALKFYFKCRCYASRCDSCKYRKWTRLPLDSAHFSVKEFRLSCKTPLIEDWPYCTFFFSIPYHTKLAWWRFRKT